MKQEKKYYIDEIKRVSEKINKDKGKFIFAVAADSHLDNSLYDSLTNISDVDERTGFRFLVHLGDFMCGNFPKKTTLKILDEQMKEFSAAVRSGVFYPVQGNHDGYCTDLSNDNAVDEDWDKVISFTNSFKNVCRKNNKPYFYADYEKEKIRIIVLCSFHYTGYYNGEPYLKQYGPDKEQTEWFKNEALEVDKGYTVMIFSHDAPFSNFSDETVFTDNTKINGNLAFKALIEKKAEKGFCVAGWFVGHYHGDYLGRIKGINFILVGSQTAYVPTLWDMPEGGEFAKRDLGTITEDLWDACILDTEHRKLKMIRFGAGKDRETDY